MMERLGIPKGKFWLLTLAIAVLAFALHKPLFIDNQPAGGPDPQGAHLALFMVVSSLSAIAMGLGVAILVFGGRVVRQLPQHLQRRGQIVRVCLFWVVAPWWVHEGLHITTGEDNIGRLIALEYGFHVTTYGAGIIAAAAVATIVVDLLAGRAQTGSAPAAELREPAGSAH